MTPIAQAAVTLSQFADVAMVVKATALIGIGLAAVRLAARSRASVRHLLLSATFAALLALPLAAAYSLDIPLSVPPDRPPAGRAGSRDRRATHAGPRRASQRSRDTAFLARGALDRARPRPLGCGRRGLPVSPCVGPLEAAPPAANRDPVAADEGRAPAARRGGGRGAAGRRRAARRSPAAPHVRHAAPRAGAAFGRARLERRRSAACVRARARARPAPRLGGTDRGARRLRRVVVPPAGVGSVAPDVPRGRARM